MDIAQYLGPERPNHPRLPRFDRVRRVETVGNGWSESAAGVVPWISEDEDQVDASVSEEIAAELDQIPSDTLSLMSG
jgi:hypothetical protein